MGNYVQTLKVHHDELSNITENKVDYYPNDLHLTITLEYRFDEEIKEQCFRIINSMKINDYVIIKIYNKTIIFITEKNNMNLCHISSKYY